MRRKQIWRRLAALALVLALLSGFGAMAAESGSAEQSAASTAAVSAEPVAASSAADSAEVAIVLSDDGITVDGQPVSEDPESAVYTGAEIIYYHDLDSYESGNPYGEGDADERHTEEEAAAHTCLTITKEGTYRISGTLSKGQIAIDLGKDRRDDPTAVVTLILDNANVTCTVAPALIFYNVYECDQAWRAYDNEEAEDYEASPTQDTSAAGANVILADGSVNTFTGSHVARIYKDNDEQKKLYKYDAAFYSVQSMNVDGQELGDGVLNIIADNEGLDSELHLTINGGKVNIQSQDDGINTNEDGVSVTTINGGSLHIVAGLGDEGDGIDSNGYLTINGGVVIALAKPESDSGLDSDMGSYINGGYVVATGSTMDWAESDSEQVTMNLQFASSQAADEAIIITDLDGKVVFAYDPEKDETTGENYRGYQGAILSCPEFAVGETYHVYIGGDVEGTDVDGLYDAATVTGFSDSAVQQQYTGTDVGGPSGGFGGFQPPEMGDGEQGEQPEMPQFGEQGDGANQPMNFTAPETEADFQPPEGGEGEMPEMPEGFGPGQNPGGAADVQSASTEFYMNDKVNAFSGVSDYDPDAASVLFTDVPAGAWYEQAVSAAVSGGAMSGLTETTFGPSEPLTKANLLQILQAKTGLSGEEFNAVLETMGDTVTRQEAMTALYQALGSPAAEEVDLSAYSDADEIDADALAAMQWAVSTGLLVGNADGTLAPAATLTRAQAAVILSRVAALQQAED